MGFAALRCLSHRSLARGGRGEGGGRAGNGASAGRGPEGGRDRDAAAAAAEARALPQAQRSRGFPGWAPGPRPPRGTRGGARLRVRSAGGGAGEDVRHALGRRGARPPRARGRGSAQRVTRDSGGRSLLRGRDKAFPATPLLPGTSAPPRPGPCSAPAQSPVGAQEPPSVISPSLHTLNYLCLLLGGWMEPLVPSISSVVIL